MTSDLSPHHRYGYGYHYRILSAQSPFWIPSGERQVLAHYLATAEDIDSFGKPVFFFLRLCLSSQTFIIDNYRGFTADALFLTSLLPGKAPLTLRDPASTQNVCGPLKVCLTACPLPLWVSYVPDSECRAVPVGSSRLGSLAFCLGQLHSAPCIASIESFS